MRSPRPTPPSVRRGDHSRRSFPRPLPDRPRRGLHPSLTTTLRAVLCVALLTLAACGPADEEQVEAPPPAVEALPARTGSLPLEQRLNGVVRADNQVVVRPEVSGRVVAVLVRSGEAVERGQPLVRLEPQGLSDQVRQAEADVRLARASLAEARAEVAELVAEVTRTRKLAAEDLVSDMDLETLEARLDAAQAAADSAAARVAQSEAAADESRFGLERAVVRAPVSGRVGRRGIEVGSIVGPDTALFVLGDLSDLVVEVPLTESMLSFVEEGQPVRVRPRAGGAEGGRAAGLGGEGGGRVLEATLSRISPFLEAGSFTTTGEIDLEGATGLRPGMFVTVDVLYGESESATLIPASALWENPRSGERGVYVVRDDQGLREAPARAVGSDVPSGADRYVDVPPDPRAVELRPVDVVAEGAGLVGVEGIAEGTWVVTVGQHLLGRQQDDRARVRRDGGAQGGGAGEGGGADPDAPLQARVRPTSWQEVLSLQDLQREDLLEGFVDKQRRLARIFGAELPASEREAEAALRRGGS